MSMTPMQEHIKRVRDAQAKEKQQEMLDSGDTKTIEQSAGDYSAFEVTKASLESDVKALQLVAKEERDEMRAKTLIPRYEGHVKAYIKSGEVYANPVLVYMIIWLIDLCRLGHAIELAKIAVAQKQEMPNHFKSNLATFIADQVLAWAEKEHKLGNSIEPYFNDICDCLDTWPVKQVVKMKYAKMTGNVAFDNEDYASAVTFYLKAIELETPQKKAGVSTKLEKSKNFLADKTQPKDETKKSLGA